MSVQREVDLSGTLLSPDQAKISSEVAGIVREVPRAARHRSEGRRRAGSPGAARAAVRRSTAPRARCGRSKRSSGIDRAQDKQPPADEQIASVRQAIANRDDARQAFERAQNLNGRGLLTQRRSRHRRNPPEGGGSELPGGARHGPQPEGEPAGSPRLVRAGAEEAGRCGDQGAGRRLDFRAPGSAGGIHPREHAGRDHRPDEPAQAEDRDPGKAREPDPSGSGGRVRRRSVPRPEIQGQDRLRQPRRGSGDAHVRGRSAWSTTRIAS